MSNSRASTVRSFPGTGRPVGTCLKITPLFWTIVAVFNWVSWFVAEASIDAKG